MRCSVVFALLVMIFACTGVAATQNATYLGALESCRLMAERNGAPCRHDAQCDVYGTGNGRCDRLLQICVDVNEPALIANHCTELTALPHKSLAVLLYKAHGMNPARITDELVYGLWSIDMRRTIPLAAATGKRQCHWDPLGANTNYEARADCLPLNSAGILHTHFPPGGFCGRRLPGSGRCAEIQDARPECMSLLPAASPACAGLGGWKDATGMHCQWPSKWSESACLDEYCGPSHRFRDERTGRVACYSYCWNRAITSEIACKQLSDGWKEDPKRFGWDDTAKRCRVNCVSCNSDMHANHVHSANVPHGACTRDVEHRWWPGVTKSQCGTANSALAAWATPAAGSVEVCANAWNATATVLPPTACEHTVGRPKTAGRCTVPLSMVVTYENTWPYTQSTCVAPPFNGTWTEPYELPGTSALPLNPPGYTALSTSLSEWCTYDYTLMASVHTYSVRWDAVAFVLSEMDRILSLEVFTDDQIILYHYVSSGESPTGPNVTYPVMSLRDGFYANLSGMASVVSAGSPILNCTWLGGYTWIVSAFSGFSLCAPSPINAVATGLESANATLVSSVWTTLSDNDGNATTPPFVCQYWANPSSNGYAYRVEFSVNTTAPTSPPSSAPTVLPTTGDVVDRSVPYYEPRAPLVCPPGFLLPDCLYRKCGNGGPGEIRGIGYGEDGACNCESPWTGPDCNYCRAPVPDKMGRPRWYMCIQLPTVPVKWYKVAVPKDDMKDWVHNRLTLFGLEGGINRAMGTAGFDCHCRPGNDEYLHDKRTVPEMDAHMTRATLHRRALPLNESMANATVQFLLASGVDQETTDEFFALVTGAEPIIVRAPRCLSDKWVMIFFIASIVMLVATCIAFIEMCRGIHNRRAIEKEEEDRRRKEMNARTGQDPGDDDRPHDDGNPDDGGIGDGDPVFNKDDDAIATAGYAPVRPVELVDDTTVADDQIGGSIAVPTQRFNVDGLPAQRRRKVRGIPAEQKG